MKFDIGFGFRTVIISSIILAVCGFSVGYAQDLAQLRIVGTPELVESGFVISNIRDANGRICAGIMIISDMTGFTYLSNNGVVKVTNSPGQDLVYLSPDERVLDIFHSGHEPLKLILSEHSVNLESKRIWKFRITGDEKLTAIPIVVITDPAGAEITIDGENLGTNKQQTAKSGSHELRLRLEGYQPIIETISVDETHTLFEYTLKKIEDVDIQISSEPSGAVLYIDDVRFGNTPISDFYPAGKYPIRLEKEWYVTYEDYIEINLPKTQKEISLTPDFGSIEVKSTPQSSMNITINDVSQDYKTPHKFERMKPGKYNISARSEFYETNEIEIQLKRGESRQVKLTSEGNFAILNINTRENAKVTIDKKVITELNNIRLQPSRITIEVTMPKAEPVIERYSLKKGDTLTVDLYPDIKTGTIQVVVDPFDTRVELKGDASEYYTSEGKQIFTDIPVGKYELIAKADGHKTYRESFTLKTNDKLKKNIALIEGSDLPENMIFVEGGSFTMGSNDGYGDEKPAHKVSLSSFYISKYEITQREWKEVIGSNPSSFKGDDLPVENVSWYDVVEYCNKKSLKEGLSPCYTIDKSKKDKNNKSNRNNLKWVVICNFYANGYRLPTETEWEYAAQGGKKSKAYKYNGSNHIKDVAWFSGDSGNKTHPIGGKKQNELGIYDMSGNVWEWCWDWYGDYSSSSATNATGLSSGRYRIIRGGSWDSIARGSRSADRTMASPDYRSENGGVRIVISSSARQKTGSLQVVIEQMEAKVELKRGNERIDSWTGSKTIKFLPVGEYKLSCSASGYNDQQKSVAITLDQTSNLEIKMIKKVFSNQAVDVSHKKVPHNMVFVEVGTFTMGSNDGGDDEKPTHKVTLSSFYIGKYEVTQKEWKGVMGNNPSRFEGDYLPVENVNWYDAVEYCNKKSIKEGLTPCYKIDGNNTTCDFNASGYRLPTEAEWEYAAHGGNKSRGYKYGGSDNISDVAWYSDNSNNKTHRVAEKKPNELGIYDMTGNVLEWCWDWYGDYSSSSATNSKGPSSGDYRIGRGGSWDYTAWGSRSANRFGSVPVAEYGLSGLRIVVSSPSVKQAKSQ